MTGPPPRLRSGCWRKGSNGEQAIFSGNGGVVFPYLMQLWPCLVVRISDVDLIPGRDAYGFALEVAGSPVKSAATAAAEVD